MKKGPKRVTLCLFLAAFLCGCGKKQANETGVLQVQEAEQPRIQQTEEEAEAALALDTLPGTVLGREEVLVIEGDEPKTVMYERVQGVEGSSLAYDPERFSIESEEGLLCFRFQEDPQAAFTMRVEEGDSAEELADQYVYDSGEECSVEEVTVGEGEYGAFRVRYAFGTEDGDATRDFYILRYNGILYVIQMDCTVELYETAGAEEQTILSTLRFDEG